MNQADWEKLSELLDEAVMGDGSWQEKKEVIRTNLSQRGYDALEELVEWFA